MSSYSTYVQPRAGKKRAEDVKILGVLIYGPQGCGKTKNADMFVEHFGKKRVMEDWSNHDVPKDTVAFAGMNAKDVPGAIYFWEALRLVCDRKLEQRE